MDISADPRVDEQAAAPGRLIVLAALRIAQAAGSWDAVHVHEVAREAGISLDELRRHFGDKDAIAEGCFDMADDALLAACKTPGWAALPVRERLYQAIMAWLDALAPYRPLTREMLGYKLHPEHLHLQARGIARISRTVQWIREVAMLPSVGWHREIEEGALTTIYLTTFSCWLADSTAGAARTRWLLRRLTGGAERAALWLR